MTYLRTLETLPPVDSPLQPSNSPRHSVAQPQLQNNNCHAMFSTGGSCGHHTIARGEYSITKAVNLIISQEAV